MSAKQLSTLQLVVLVAGLALLLSACDLVIASDPPPPAPVRPSGVTPAPPAAVPAATPDLQPTVDAVVQQRLAEILTPSPRSGVKPVAQPDPESAAPPGPPAAGRPTPEPVQPPNLAPVGNFQPQYYRSGFACTGSMRPTIDCGDEGVFLKAPFQEPLMVGDIISFSPEESCRHYKNHDISKAHRIDSVRVENGTNYYTTKGDSALNPDPCEVTIEQIDGKLAEVKKGVRPQDMIDTSEYDFAKEKVQHLKEQYLRERADYDQSKAEYEAHGKEYERLVASYQEGSANHRDVVEFHQELEKERMALNQLMDELNSLGEEINSTIDDVDRIYQELFVR